MIKMELEDYSLEQRRKFYRQDPFNVLDFAIQVHEPQEEKRGNVLLLSSNRRLNWTNGEFLSRLGYESVTGITVRDLEEVILPQYDGAFDMLALNPPVHVEHHEVEDFVRNRMELMESNRNGVDYKPGWRLENLKKVYQLVSERQETNPLVFISSASLKDGYQPDITEKGLHDIGIKEFYTFCASDILTSNLQ